MVLYPRLGCFTDDDLFRLSRKDALKRHAEAKHPEYAKLLKDLELEILVPRRRNEPLDLEKLRKAMFPPKKA